LAVDPRNERASMPGRAMWRRGRARCGV